MPIGHLFITDEMIFKEYATVIGAMLFILIFFVWLIYHMHRGSDHD